MHKVDGYKMIFEEGGNKRKNFEIGDLKSMVYLFLHTDDINKLPQNGYRNYWFDNIDNVLTRILAEQKSC